MMYIFHVFSSKAKKCNAISKNNIFLTSFTLIKVRGKFNSNNLKKIVGKKKRFLI